MEHYTNKDIKNLVGYCTHLDACIKHAKKGKLDFWTISSEVSKGIDLLSQYNSLKMVKQDSEEFDAVSIIKDYVDTLDKLIELQDIAGTMIGDSDD